MTDSRCLRYLRAACYAHPQREERVATCSHGALVKSVRRVPCSDGAFVLEAVCAECRKMIDAKTPWLAQIRLGCGDCIRAAFPEASA